MLSKVQVKILPVRDNPPDQPSYATLGSSGADLRSALESYNLLPGERVLIPTGYAIQLPEGYEAQVRPRSGLALKHGITVLNAPGSVDFDFRGEVGVILVNHGSTPFHISFNDRIAQLVIAPVVQGSFQMSSVGLSTTERGSGGYGSTGTI